MNDLVVQRFLKYVICFICASVFLSSIQVSLASGKNEAVASHNAGKNCLTNGCHGSGGWKLFSLGGTIYKDSGGTTARAGARIKVVDINGITTSLTSDQLGNFYSARSMTPPFTISVSYRGRMVKMPGAAIDGGCNAEDCHIAGSAGRVYISTEDLDLTGTVTSADTGNSQEIHYNNDEGHEKINSRIATHNNQRSSSAEKTIGAAIANAKVSLSRKGRIKYRTTTDSTGTFTFKKIKANEYTLKVARNGYKIYKQFYEMKQKDVLPLEITLSKK